MSIEIPSEVQQLIVGAACQKADINASIASQCFALVTEAFLEQHLHGVDAVSTLTDKGGSISEAIAQANPSLSVSDCNEETRVAIMSVVQLVGMAFA